MHSVYASYLLFAVLFAESPALLQRAAHTVRVTYGILAASTCVTPDGFFVTWKFKRVYGQFCIEPLHESRKWKSNGLSCLVE